MHLLLVVRTRAVLLIVAPAQLERLAHERVKAGRCAGTHALSITHAVDLALFLEASARTLRRCAQLVSGQLDTWLGEL